MTASTILVICETFQHPTAVVRAVEVDPVRGTVTDRAEYAQEVRIPQTPESRVHALLLFSCAEAVPVPIPEPVFDAGRTLAIR